MDCKDAKKHIHEYLDGDADLAAITEHLAHCASCRAYLETLQKQKDLLGSLSAKNAPSFNLAAAKRRKKSNLSRTVRWASAAAAVFVVVLLAGSMTGLFTGAKSEAPSAKSIIAEVDAETGYAEEAGFALYDIEETAAEEAAPAEEAPAEEEAAPAEEAPAEEAAAPPEKEEAPEGGWAEEEQRAEEVAAEEAPAEEESEVLQTHLSELTLSEPEYTELVATLSKKGISIKSSGNETTLFVTEQNIDLLKRIFIQHTDLPLSEGTSIFIRKE